jgi:hypothetical protein
MLRWRHKRPPSVVHSDWFAAGAIIQEPSVSVIEDIGDRFQMPYPEVRIQDESNSSQMRSGENIAESRKK